MARGRKPDTDEQQVAKGAPGKRMTAARAQAVRQRTRVDAVVIGNVSPPKWLRKSRKATEIWNALAPELAKLKMLHRLDATPLARYCRYVVEWIAADVAVQKEGTWYEAKDTNGEPTKKRHPAWQACQDLEKMLRDLEATFGMRPDARYKILRDQSVAHGLGGLPLFEDQQQPEGAEETDRPAVPHPQQQVEPEDFVGILRQANSAPPGRLN